MFGTWLADLVFASTLTVVYVAWWRAPGPPADTTRPFSQTSGVAIRSLTALYATAVTGLLPALVFAAAAGGKLA